VSQALPVSAKIGSRLPACGDPGVTFGTIAALKQNTLIDYLLMSSAMAGVVIPGFVLAPLLVLFFSIYLGWFPAGGWQGGGCSSWYCRCSA
jgi:oligopeptide transport system permease protein